MMIQEVVRRPIVTEKAVAQREASRVMCFEVAVAANKVQIRAAVERIFKVKVESVRTENNAGKVRRRGRFSGYGPDWKKAYVTLKPGQKIPEYAEV
jgi:large subunit ribosomal protein L23